MTMQQDIDKLAQELGMHLRTRGECVASAESCTGGLICAALTEVAGSSDWFGYGFVTYSNEAKQALLGVSADTLAIAGAVSEQTVREMVAGARRVSGAEWAVSVSGIAGPSGGSAEKPVGTVWFAVSGPDGDEAFVRRFDGGRTEVRRQTVLCALSRLVTRVGQSVSLV
jgi:nicotinamide-nucleotide amidase